MFLSTWQTVDGSSAWHKICMGSSRLLDWGPWVVLQPWRNGTDNHPHASSAREHDPYYGYGLGSHAESNRKCLSPCAGNWTGRYPIHTHIHRVRYSIEALESQWHKGSTRLCWWLNSSYHLAPTLDAQQRHADLISGFCAITALELSLTKVEAISMNYGKIFRDKPFLRLGDWQWRPHSVQHHDNGYWTRYIGLYLDKQACAKHFHKDKLKLQTMCHLLAQKFAPPAAKRLVYNLCLKSQIRYSAGLLAPWTTTQYQELDRIPTALLRLIHCDVLSPRTSSMHLRT